MGLTRQSCPSGHSSAPHSLPETVWITSTWAGSNPLEIHSGSGRPGWKEVLYSGVCPSYVSRWMDSRGIAGKGPHLVVAFTAWARGNAW